MLWSYIDTECSILNYGPLKVNSDRLPKHKIVLLGYEKIYPLIFFFHAEEEILIFTTSPKM